MPVGDMDKWRARGVNTLIGAGLEGKKDQAELDAWAGAAEARGLWVIVDPKKAKPYKNLYAFMLPDEVDAKQSSFKPAVERWDGWTAAQVKPLFDAFRAIDPQIPVFMSLSGAKITGGAGGAGDRIAYYKSLAPFCDLWMEDGYPRNMNASRYDEALWPGRACAVLKAAAPDKPLVAMIETDDQNLWNSPNGRGPTVAETVEAIRQARANGASHLGVFTHYFNDQGGWDGWDRTTPETAAVIAAEFYALTGGPATRPTTLPSTRPTTLPTFAPSVASVRAEIAAAVAKLDALPRPVYTVEASAASLGRAGWTPPLTHLHVAVYADGVGMNGTRRPAGTNTLKIPHENLRAAARLCRDGGVVDNPWVKGVQVVAGAPVVLDWEGPEFADLANLPVYCEYVRVFRDEWPQGKVAVNFNAMWAALTLETWVAGPTPEQLAPLEEGIKRVKPLAELCDFVVAGMYLSAPEAIERDLTGYQRAHDWARARYGGKPFYAYLNPCWCYHKSPTWREADGWGNRVNTVPVDPASARRVLDLALRYDAAVCWPAAGVYGDVVKGQAK